MTKATQKFSIIRQRGEPNEVTTIWGWQAFRQEELFAPDPYNTLVPCLHYDNHFIYEVPEKLEHSGVPAFMCTCGSAAVVVGPGAYLKDASISNFTQVEATPIPGDVTMLKITRGFVFACLLKNCVIDPETQELYNKHGDGSS